MSAADEHQDWLAMQYVLGELSDSERDAFEVRLTDDPAVCEAVTAASRLVLTARAAFAELDGAHEWDGAQEPDATSANVVAVNVVPAVVSGVAGRGVGAARGSWFAVAVTTAALAMLCLFILPSPNRPGIEPSPSRSQTEVASQDPAAAATLVSRWRSGMSLSNDEPDDVEELAEPHGDMAVPGWMLAAVAFEASESIDGPSDMTREN